MGLSQSLIAGARSRIEALAGVAMITRTLRVTMDWWPRGSVDRRTVVLPVRPADELVAVRVFNGSGVAQTVTGSFHAGAGAFGAAGLDGWRVPLAGAAGERDRDRLSRRDSGTSRMMWRRVFGWR